MNLEDWGYNEQLEKFRTGNNLQDFQIGRVIAEHKERYIVKTLEGEAEAEITGNMRFTARSREDFPAVGDWVALTVYDANFAIIHQLFPRSSLIKRQAVGQKGEVQVIGANIDEAFIIQAVDRDFNINRLERYLTICNSSGVSPIIVLSKTDLIDSQQLELIMGNIHQRLKNVPLIAISNETREGYDAILQVIKMGYTYCMLGSSGVGKSTLLNNLSGREIMKTGQISETIQRGRHVTSHRELILLEGGGLLIDNPGMREVGIADAAQGLETTFDTIMELSEHCRFKDCTHTTEQGCAVLEAIEKGELDESAYQNYLKMEREKEHFESTIAERRKRDKQFGKILKDYYKKDVKQRKL
jgi:ribosome biogenesis GTPase